MLRACVATAGVVLGLALAATTAEADTNPAPLGTSVGKVTHKARPGVRSGTTTKAAAKVVRKSRVARVRIRAKAAPARKITRRVEAAHSYHAARVVRTAPRRTATVHRYRPHKVIRRAVKRAPHQVTRHHRIFKAQRKNAAAPTVRAAHLAAPSKARLVHRAKVTHTKIDKAAGKIIKPSLRKATTARTIPSLAVGDLPVPGLAIVTPEITVHVLPGQASIPPVGVTVPLPLVGQPPVTVPGAEPATVISGRARATAVEPLSQADQGVAPIARTLPAQGQARIAGTPQRILIAGVTMLTAHPTGPTLPVQAWAIASIGPPAVAILEELGQRVSSAKASPSVGPTATALVLAVALGAAATGTVGSGSAGWSGLAVASAALRLPAFRGSSRLCDWLRQAAFRRPRLPGFSPD